MYICSICAVVFAGIFSNIRSCMANIYTVLANPRSVHRWFSGLAKWKRQLLELASIARLELLFVISCFYVALFAVKRSIDISAQNDQPLLSPLLKGLVLLNTRCFISGIILLLRFLHVFSAICVMSILCDLRLFSRQMWNNTLDIRRKFPPPSYGNPCLKGSCCSYLKRVSYRAAI